ncbi:MAG: TonB family protein [Proteobacteria bacterium]|nr:TonB family protein [Pseudomonadota bacterium]MCH8163082.1 TonB family protein [Pseudomonadota bacterium]
MRSLLRTLFVIPQAALVTLLLLVLMVSLIEFSDKSLDKVKRIKLPDIYMPDVEIEIQRLIEKPEKPEVDETPPPDIPEQDFDKIDGNAAVGQVAAPGNMRPKLDLNIGAGLQATDGEYLPIVKVAPQYPRRALSRGIEGYVIVEYTVTKLGTVKDPRVVEGKPQGTFDRAAIKSALRYKYKPRVVDGEPIEVKGVRTRITFELEE